ncbi:MAG TPA: hypothetical protein DHW15_02565 [Bacteroidetes bacterium]|jgi:NADH:ubiquinone oxidoreductase subunit|nr:MAG: hypothetical protein ABR94_13135 [Sphingobacteriales bacterium BACL12 MAG-120802-bin5]KRP11520.1 MAG: hypothetical protein ABR95_07630 [Sphingobacteriales bacterium BACL12 MAG-120813-bin55]HCK21068.1 hypothetical protein [Bacteroidota bacterium]
MKIEPKATFYGIVSGLPELTMDKPAVSELGNLTHAFSDFLSDSDKYLLMLAYVPQDHKRLFQLMDNKEAAAPPFCNFTDEQYRDYITNGASLRVLPDFNSIFSPDQQRHKTEQRFHIAWVQQCLQAPNRLLQAYVQLQVAVHNDRIKGFRESTGDDLSSHLLDREVIIQALGTSELLEDNMSAWIHLNMENINKESSWEEREWQTDMLFWNWLNEQLFQHLFTIERLLVYAFQQQIAARWASIKSEEKLDLHILVDEIIPV